jgi:predicted PurR-regulated permease PerM
MSTTPTPPVGESQYVGGAGYGAPQKPRPGSSLAIVALVLGALAFILCFIPVVNFVAFALAVASVACALISLLRKMGGKAMAIIGLVLSVIAFIGAIIVNALVAAAVSTASHEISKSLETYSAQASAKHTIQYKVTANAPATVHYWAPDGSSQTDVSADWSKDVTSTGFTSAFVTVTASDYQNKSSAVSCEILIDGKSVAKNTGSGALASASCNGTAG